MMFQVSDDVPQQWKSVFNAQEVKTPFSAKSPPPPGSDDTELLFGLPVTDKKNEEAAGRDEAYGASKEKIQLAGVALRKLCFCQQANGSRSGYWFRRLCPYTLVLLYPCIKLCQHLST